jgi:hypothetical protein
MACLIIGDSIALGLSSVLKGCAVIAKVGVSSGWILAHAYGGNFNTVYISSGSNDPYNHSLTQNLINTKNRYPNSKHIWIAPVNSNARNAVYQAASGEKVITFVPGSDNVHPRSYASLIGANVSHMHKYH